LAKNSQYISNNKKMKRETKMAKSKNRIKKMTFLTQDRKYVPLSENDKYVIEMAGYAKENEGSQNEDIQRTTRGVTRPQYI